MPPDITQAAVAPTIVLLEGEALGEVAEAITHAFNREELKILLKFKMSFNLERELNTAAGDDALVFELLEKLQRLGTLLGFLRHALEMRPNNAELRDVLTRRCREALDPAPDPKDSAKTAAAGIDVVKQRLDTFNVRDLVAPHRAELLRLMDDIEVLANYKILHDVLQTIQFTHQPQMASDMQRLRTDATAGMTLEAHLFQLEELYRKAQKAAEALPDTAAVRAAELRWVNKLGPLIDQINQALQSVDDQDGLRAMRAIRSTIRLEPFRINALLSMTAERLALERLVSTIASVAQAISAQGSAPAEICAGLTSLQSMLPQLKGRVAEHNQWQDIEREFIDTDDFIELGTPVAISDFQDLWPAAKQSVAALASTEPAAPWAQKSQKYSAAVDTDLAGNMAGARSDFAVFRHTVLFHFFQVDRDLRYQCEAILGIKAALKSLLNEV